MFVDPKNGKVIVDATQFNDGCIYEFRALSRVKMEPKSEGGLVERRSLGD